jgi:predicted nucleic acid-binding protein
VTVVLDASAAIAVAQRHLSPPILDKSWVVVPDVFVSEVSNAVWKMHRFGGTPRVNADVLLDRAVRIPDETVPSDSLYRDAFNSAISEKHPVYDLFYLVLARRERAAILTLDKELHKLAKKHGVATA